MTWRNARNDENFFKDFLRDDGQINSVAQLTNAVQLSSYNCQPPWCLYEGVTCGNVAGISSYGMVQSISLKNLALTGTLPDSIGDFRSLTLFDISSNHIHGTIPDTIINWRGGISSISLDANNLTGTIPAAIGYLLSLTAVHLHDNSLQGPIPSVVGSLNSLSILTLGRNSLTGTIPSTVGSMAALQHFSLNSNLLTGTIPSGISALSRLVFFDAADNFLSTGSARTLTDITLSDAAGSRTLELSSRRLIYQSDTQPWQNSVTSCCIPAILDAIGES